MLSNIGTPELLIISGVLFFLFGAKKLPELSRGIATSIREFKGAVKE